MKLKSKVARNSRFVPFPNKVEVEPIRPDTFLNVDSNVITSGKVLSVGMGVKYCKVGDTLLFRAYGCDTIEFEGKNYYIVTIDPQFILGKYEK